MDCGDGGGSGGTIIKPFKVLARVRLSPPTAVIKANVIIGQHCHAAAADDDDNRILYH